MIVMRVIVAMSAMGDTIMRVMVVVCGMSSHCPHPLP
jgi:hypothetical protein